MNCLGLVKRALQEIHLGLNLSKQQFKVQKVLLSQGGIQQRIKSYLTNITGVKI